MESCLNFTSQLYKRAYTQPCSFAILVLLTLLSSATELRAATVTATWNPNPEVNIAGYQLSYGTKSGSYTTTIDVGKVTSTTLTLADGTTYYFAVRAYNTTGLISSYSAEASVTTSAAAGSSTAPSISNVTPTSGAAGVSVTITGSNFGSTKGTSTVTFNGVAATPTSWSATSIGVPVPSGATTGNVVVTVGSVASNGLAFTVTTTTAAPSLTSLSPVSGAVGTAVTIAGSNFGSTKGTSTVTFNGVAGTPTIWSATSIVVPVPSGTATGNVVVTVGGVASNGQTFTVTTSGSPVSIGFVQRNYATPQSPTASVSVPFTSAQSAGNLNVVAVGWNDSTQTVQSVKDSNGNIYVRAVGPTVLSGQLSQSIYYAPNIASASAGANTVTVTFSGAAAFPDVRVAEYRGVDPTNPYDGGIGATGTSTTSDSGTLTTTASSDLLVGANMVTNVTNSAGTGYTSRVITSPDADILEDRVVTAAGSYNATAPVSGGSWVMQLAAFRAASGTSSPVPSLTSLSPANGAVGTVVTIAGSNFGSTKGTSSVMFNGTAGTPTSWSATSIVVPVPSGATTGNVVVTVGGVASNALTFTVTSTTTPSLTSLSPTSGTVGTVVTIAGSNFGSTKGTSSVTFNGTAATPTSWSATSIVVPVPSGATTGNVVVTVGGVASNGRTFTVTTAAPSLTSLSPTSGAVGTVVTIAGSNFGSTKGTSSVTFNGTVATPTSWSATSIVAPVPSGATTGSVVVTVGGVASNGQTFTVTSTTPSVTTLSPTSGAVGTAVTITGSNFGSTKGTSSVTFNGTVATPTSWSATSIVAPVPSGATTGNVVVTVGGVASNGQPFTVTTPVSISFVQRNYATPQSPTATVAVPYTAAQSAGNLNVVAVGWNDSTSTVQSVKDSKGNVYLRAVGPTVLSGQLSQSIYYAANIGSAAAGANTVTVTFSGAASFPDVRIAEYRGLDPASPFDGGVGATGTSTTSNSGALTTTGANELLIGANMVTWVTSAAGTGYTSRVITSPDGDILEDRVVTTAGSYNATAPLSGGSWVMQIVAFRAASGSVTATALMSAAAAPPEVANDSSRASDYDGDNRSDLAVFTPSSGKWAVLQSSSNYMNSFSLTLGASTDVPVPGDYDGDGKADVAIFTPSTGNWTVLKSSSAFASKMSTTWGVSGDVPVPGDYDGDQKTDFAVFRPSTGEWLLTLSATQTTKTIVLGAPGDQPVAGDYDGDGLTDPGVFTPSTGTWTVLTSSSNFASRLTGKVGVSSDLLVPGDYDGDGRTDMAVYRASTGSWLILGSATGFGTTRTVTLGSSGDIPVPGDYDADGVTDVATYRPSTGQWSIVKSSDGSTLTSVWGTSGSDVPLPKHP
jgi:IPT/TIG domain-containing protein/VCBS repeat protein